MKRKFLVTVEVEFDSEELDEFDGIEEFEDLDEKIIFNAVDTGFNYNASEELFGESLIMLGMLTPQVLNVKEIK